MNALWKTLHIISMFLAFAFFMAPNLFAVVALRTRDGGAIKRTVEGAKIFDRLGGASIGLGVVFGIITALTGDISLLSGWLVTAYILLALIIIVGEGLVAPRLRRVAAAIGEQGTMSPDAQALIRSSGLGVLTLVPPALFLGVVYVMVNKPFA
ncbi:MAG TPA: DUF2269 family protein [Actinomycetota bacterium]|nr:DUF2269 family protein [Actinomycetota bacterium]